MEYINAKTAAKKWGIGERRVRFYCVEKKIPGAKYLGKQWMIPSTAPRPIDGRTKAGRQHAEELYFFPALLHSRAYAHRDELDEVNNKLLDAQLEHIRGDYGASMRICRELEDMEPGRSVLAGVYATDAFNAMLLGLYSEYSNAIRRLEELIANELSHTEDFRLLLEVTRYHITWDPAPLKNIDFHRLSPEALDLYTAILAMISVVNVARETDNSVLAYEVFCRCLELQEMLPTAMAVHAMLANMNEQAGDMPRALSHIEACYRIAAENGWKAHLAKSMGVANTAMKEYLGQRDPKLLETLSESFNRTIVCWQMIKHVETGFPMLDTIQPQEGELLLLIAGGATNQDIAAIRKINNRTLQQQIHNLCEKLDVKDKRELRAIAREMFRISLPMIPDPNAED